MSLIWRNKGLNSYSKGEYYSGPKNSSYSLGIENIYLGAFPHSPKERGVTLTAELSDIKNKQAEIC